MCGTASQCSSLSGGVSGGAVAGIVIGCILGLSILMAICRCCYRRYYYIQGKTNQRTVMQYQEPVNRPGIIVLQQRNDANVIQQQGIRQNTVKYVDQTPARIPEIMPPPQIDIVLNNNQGNNNQGNNQQELNNNFQQGDAMSQNGGAFRRPSVYSVAQHAGYQVQPNNIAVNQQQGIRNDNAQQEIQNVPQQAFNNVELENAYEGMRNSAVNNNNHQDIVQQQGIPNVPHQNEIIPQSHQSTESNEQNQLNNHQNNQNNQQPKSPVNNQ